MIGPRAVLIRKGAAFHFTEGMSAEVESLVELQRRAAEEVLRAISGQPTRNPVNPEVYRNQPLPQS